MSALDSSSPTVKHYYVYVTAEDNVLPANKSESKGKVDFYHDVEPEIKIIENASKVLKDNPTTAKNPKSISAKPLFDDTNDPYNTSDARKQLQPLMTKLKDNLKENHKLQLNRDGSNTDAIKKNSQETVKNLAELKKNIEKYDQEIRDAGPWCRLKHCASRFFSFFSEDSSLHQKALDQYNFIVTSLLDYELKNELRGLENPILASEMNPTKTYYVDEYHYSLTETKNGQQISQIDHIYRGEIVTPDMPEQDQRIALPDGKGFLVGLPSKDNNLVVTQDGNFINGTYQQDGTEIIADIKCFDEKWKLHGKVTVYNRDMSVKEQGIYDHGKKTGDFIQFPNMQKFYGPLNINGKPDWNKGEIVFANRSLDNMAFLNSNGKEIYSTPLVIPSDKIDGNYEGELEIPAFDSLGKYSGQFSIKDGKASPEGQGIMKYSDEHFFEGIFKNGMPKNGVLTIANQSYNIEFVNGVVSFVNLRFSA